MSSRANPPPPKGRAGQDSIPAEPPRLHSSRRRRHSRLSAAQERPPSAVWSRVEPCVRCEKVTLLHAPAAQLRAATPTAARDQLAVHAQQAWPLACAVNERNRMVRARGLHARPTCSRGMIEVARLIAVLGRTFRV